MMIKEIKNRKLDQNINYRIGLFIILFIFSFLYSCDFISNNSGQNSNWSIYDKYDGLIFPSVILSTAHLTAEKYKELDTANVNAIGNPNGCIAVKIVNLSDNSKITIDVDETPYFKKTTFEAVLPKANTEYKVYPKLLWDYDKLRKQTEPVPVDVTFKVSINGQASGSQSKTYTMRSINECLFCLVDDQNQYQYLNFYYAAYINEDHPFIDQILREAINTRIVSSFTGYQSKTQESVLNQVFAIWNVLQQRGFTYSSITETSQTSNKVFSQRVRLLDDALNTSQANCVDGTVLFASFLRAISIDPIIVLVPGHMFLGFYTDADHKTAQYLETTLMGQSNISDYPVNADNEQNIPSQYQVSYQNFYNAILYAGNEINTNLANFSANNGQPAPGYMYFEVSKNLRQYIKPISKNI